MKNSSFTKTVEMVWLNGLENVIKCDKVVVKKNYDEFLLLMAP